MIYGSDYVDWSGHYVNMDLYPTTTEMIFSEVNWNNSKSGNPWETPGGDFSDRLLFHMGVAYGQNKYGENAHWLRIPLNADYCDSLIRGTAQHLGWIFDPTTNCRMERSFCSAEYAVDSLRPTLRIIVEKQPESFISVISPMVGQRLMQKKEVTLGWLSPKKEFDVYLYKAGEPVLQINTSITENFLNWECPSTIVSGEDYTIRVVSEAVYGASEPFTIDEYRCSLTVVGGSGTGVYTPGESITIVADEPLAKQTFLSWNSSMDILNDNNESTTSLIVPDEDLRIESTYDWIPYTIPGTIVAGQTHYIGPYIDWIGKGWSKVPRKGGGKSDSVYSALTSADNCLDYGVSVAEEGIYEIRWNYWTKGTSNEETVNMYLGKRDWDDEDSLPGEPFHSFTFPLCEGTQNTHDYYEFIDTLAFPQGKYTLTVSHDVVSGDYNKVEIGTMSTRLLKKTPIVKEHINDNIVLPVVITNKGGFVLHTPYRLKEVSFICKIFTLSGRQVGFCRNSMDSHVFKVNLKSDFGLSTGVYFIHFEFANGEKVVKRVCGL